VNEEQLNSHIPMTPEKITELKVSTKSFIHLQTLRDNVENGWPSVQFKVKAIIQKYWSMKDKKAYIDGVL